MVINVGSIEPIVVEVIDQLGTLDELPVGTLYDIKDTDGNNISLNQIATVVGMTAYCLVDATTMVPGDYDIFLKFTTIGDSPVLGPYRFRVN